MKDEIYLGMRPGDLEGKPYAKYWNPEMQPLQPQVRDAVVHGDESPELAFGMDEADQLMQPGYLPLENGTAQLPNGQTFVAVLTRMPKVTGEMLEWWMGWHYMEAQRYKLWHPRCHVGNGTKEMLGDNPELSNKKKYMTTHYVSEYVGSRLENIAITFVEPKTIFKKSDDLSANGVSALICGYVTSQDVPVTIGHLVHQIRHVEGGAEMRSRFWLGKLQFSNINPASLRNKIIGTRLVAKRVVPSSIGRDMLVHCGMEMNHLASFLPDLYADYHSK